MKSNRSGVPDTAHRLHLVASVGLPLLVLLSTSAVFSSALRNDFVEWDDYANFVNNPHYRGLAWANIRWMLTAVLMGQWIPVTWLTLGLDFRLWGMDPFGYHLTNVVLHMANAFLFYRVALRVLRIAITTAPEGTRRLGAAAAALFFALHPLRVESVAWVTERRDVVSGLFFLLTVLTYLRAVTGNSRRRWLAISLGCFLLGVGSKAIVVTLPAVLLLLDVYPLRRLRGLRTLNWRRSARQVLLEKVPYVLLAGVGAVMAVHAMRANSFLTPMDRLPGGARITVVLNSVWFYFSRTVVPLALSPLYELPLRVNPFELRFLVATIGVAVMTGLAMLLWRRWPAGLTAWAVYAILLSPVSGIVHNGHQLTHDRYSYIPCLPWALLFGAGIVGILQAKARGTVRASVARLALAASATWLIALPIMSLQQASAWRDTDSLWRYAIESDPTCSICQSNLGTNMYNRHLIALATERFERALTLRPDRVRVHGNLGLARLAAGKPADAVVEFERVLERFPLDHDTRVNLAIALAQSHRPAEALSHLQRVIQEEPTHAGAHTNLGTVLVELGKPADAIAAFRRALELRPDFPQPRAGLVHAWLALGDVDGARAEYAALRRIDRSMADSIAPRLIQEW